MKISIFLVVFNIILTSNCLVNRRNELYPDDEYEPKPEADSMDSDQGRNDDHGSDSVHEPFWNSFRLSRKFSSNRPVFFKPKTRPPLLVTPLSRMIKKSSSTIKPIVKMANNDGQPLMVGSQSSTIAPKKAGKMDKRFKQSTSTSTTTTTTEPPPTTGSVLIMSGESDNLDFDVTSLINGSLLSVDKPNY